MSKQCHICPFVFRKFDAFVLEGEDIFWGRGQNPFAGEKGQPRLSSLSTSFASETSPQNFCHS